MSPAVRTAAFALGGATHLWLFWRTLKTGMPAGNPKMHTRAERPVQFWVAAIMFAGAGAWYAALTMGL